jgi:hypothetical protein
LCRHWRPTLSLTGAKLEGKLTPQLGSLRKNQNWDVRTFPNTLNYVQERKKG